MIKILNRAAAVALPYSFVTALILILTNLEVTTFDEQGNVTGSIVGMDSIWYQIEWGGWLSYISDQLVIVGAIFIFVFIPLVIYGFIHERSKNS